MKLNRTRAVVSAAFLGLTLLGATGCTADFAGARPPASATAASGPSGGSSQSAGAGTAGAVTTGAAGSTGTPETTTAAPQCLNGDIRVAMSHINGAMGHESILLLFTNATGHRCFLRGYPGAALINPDDTVALNADRTLTGMMGGAEGMSEPPTVFVAPGQTVSAVIEWDDNQAVGRPACLSTANLELLVTPPDSTLSTTLPFPNEDITDICPETFLVHPVLAGVYGRPPGT